MIGRGCLLAEGTLAEVVQGANVHLSYRLVVGSAEQALQVLGDNVSTVEVSRIDAETDRLGGAAGEEIRLSLGAEEAGPVVRELVAGGVEVRALVPVRPNLEDLFLELTEGGER